MKYLIKGTDMKKILIISLFSIILCGCRISPWKTVKFTSCKDYTSLITEKGFNELLRQYPDSSSNDVFMYTISNAYNEVSYETKEPYAFVFVFLHYTPDITIKVNSLCLIDGDKKLPVNFNFPMIVDTDYDIRIKYDSSPSKETKNLKSKYMYGSIMTEHIYKIQKDKNISIEMEVEVENTGNIERKILKQQLIRVVNRGLFQY